MAKIEDLIAQIPDDRLKKAIGAEVRELKKNKKFGLVFEEHLPETVRLPKLPVKEGELVAKKRETGNELWRVKSIRKGIATLERAIEGYPLPSETGIEMPVAELVVVRSFGDPIYPALVPVDHVARGGPDKPWHMLINADNFHALQLLLYTHARKVDCIYIDPPYNTGARDWKYNNDYVDEADKFRHSKWLGMIERRLRLAKQLLNPEDSVLIVTIDEKEVHRLGLLLEQVFPKSRAQMVTYVINAPGQTRLQELSRVEEYAYFLFFGAAIPSAVHDDLLNEKTSHNPKTIRWESLLRSGTNSRRADRPALFYPVFIERNSFLVVSAVGDSKPLTATRSDWVVPNGTIAVWPLKSDGSEGNWRASPEYFRRLLAAGHVRVGEYREDAGRGTFWYLGKSAISKITTGEILVVGRDEQGAVVIKPNSDGEKKRTTIAKTVWNRPSHHAGWHGSALVRGLLPGRSFPFPKSLFVVEDSLRIALAKKKRAVVLDFFTGSGTTAHAVMRLNKQDGGTRQSISVTNNEVAAEEQQALLAQGLRPGDTKWEQRGICEHITMPRLRAAITGKTSEGHVIQGDYKFTDVFPMADGFAENLEHFRLEFLDPDEVARGDAFKAIVPILWMLAGCRGEREDSKATTPWFIPKHSPFAVLIQEKQFRAFREKLTERKDIEWVFLITDSEENFGQMRRRLGRKFECVQLYKSYLENFRINTQDALNG